MQEARPSGFALESQSQRPPWRTRCIFFWHFPKAALQLFPFENACEISKNMSIHRVFTNNQGTPFRTTSPLPNIFFRQGLCSQTRIRKIDGGFWRFTMTPWIALLLCSANPAFAQDPSAPLPPNPEQPIEPAAPVPAPAENPPPDPGTTPAPAGNAAPGDILGAQVVSPTPPENMLLPELLPEGMLPFSTTAAEIEKRRSIPFKEPSKENIASEIDSALNEVGTRRISLMDAVQIALLNDPIIRLATEEVAIAEASRQIAAGLFDARLAAGVSYERRHSELSEAEVAQNQDQFDRNNALVKATREQRAKIEDELAGLETGVSPPSATKEGQIQQELDAAALEILKQLGIAANIDVGALDRKGKELQKQGIETRKDILKTLESTEKNAIKQNKQFPVVSVRRTDTMLYNLSVIKQFRNGLVLKPYLEYDNNQNNLSRRGGQRRINRNEIGLDLTIPLARGRGTIAASGQEMAAEIDIEASQLSLQHTVAERMLSVASAYWAMAAAQEQLAYLVRSEITSSALVMLTDALIKADEVPRAGASQPQARFAQAIAQRYQAEISLQDAQQNLALTMGVGEEGILYAPLAADSLPDVLKEEAVKQVSVRSLAHSAFDRRADYRASRKTIDSGKILAEQARLNIKPRVDLGLSGFITGRDQDGSRDGVYHLYTENQAGPGFSVSLRMDWPFRQNEAKGAYALREATLTSRLEQLRLINNGIVSGISRAWFQLKLTARQLQKQEEAVDLYGKALGTERERFRLGTATLIDAIQTEERLTQARAQLVNTRLQHALALLRMRFETGTLMPHDDAGRSRIDRQNFVTLPNFDPVPIDDAISPRTNLKDFKSKVFGETDPHRVLKKLYEKEAKITSKKGAPQTAGPVQGSSK